MTGYKAFDIRASIIAIVATVLVSTSSLLFAAGPVAPAKSDAPQTSVQQPIA